uniref:Uncharacterized protein n=1 Tax=Triticum urartu TaxID=4572 RepID=A0A8R7JXF8_TRIUA
MKLTKVTFALFSLDRTSLYGTTHIQHSSKSVFTRFSFCDYCWNHPCWTWMV